MACFDLDFDLDESLNQGCNLLSKGSYLSKNRSSRFPTSNLSSYDDLDFENSSNFLEMNVNMINGSETPNINVKRYRNAPLTFHDSYRSTGRILGRGAYATVEACIHRKNGKEYAVKIIDKSPDHSRFRIIKEIELFNLCFGHSNIVQLIEYFEENDKFYLIFEVMRGGPLLNHIQRRICFTEHEASMVVRDIARGLKFLHDKGIAHRDLKPENILCTNPNTVSPVKLCDLDLASKNNLYTFSRSTSITTPELQSPVGSAEFMAPEVVDAFVGDSLHYDKRCDLWSLGVILYIMLCGYPPFYGECTREDCGWNQGLSCDDCQDSLFSKIQSGQFEFPEQDWSEISEDAKELIKHLLERDVNRRYMVDDVLAHPFVVNKASNKPLQTPNILSRIDSKRDLAENFAAADRMKFDRRSQHGVLKNQTSTTNATGCLTTIAGAITVIPTGFASQRPPDPMNHSEITIQDSNKTSNVLVNRPLWTLGDGHDEIDASLEENDDHVFAKPYPITECATNCNNDASSLRLTKPFMNEHRHISVPLDASCELLSTIVVSSTASMGTGCHTIKKSRSAYTLNSVSIMTSGYASKITDSTLCSMAALRKSSLPYNRYPSTTTSMVNSGRLLPVGV